MRIRLIVVHASSEGDLEQAFVKATGDGAQALVVGSDAVFNRLRNRFAELAARHRVPAIYSLRENVIGGGLMSYGADFVETYRQAGSYVSRILKGEKASELPVMQSTKFELLINQAAARTLALDLPPTLLALADEVIE
jgi:putative tryptophan/tyrosine transport system substrate-binding protein